MNEDYAELLRSNNLSHENVVDKLTELQSNELISIQLYDVLITSLDIAGGL